MIKKVAQNIEIPLLVGGGIVDLQAFKMRIMQSRFSGYWNRF
jgi:imidazole glycerol phosphate synthase subunit HisF